MESIFPRDTSLQLFEFYNIEKDYKGLENETFQATCEHVFRAIELVLEGGKTVEVSCDVLSEEGRCQSRGAKTEFKTCPINEEIKNDLKKTVS